MERVDVLVLGAGAAGLFAGIEAARRGRSVLVVDHAARPGEKIRISGGGRCNFTNLAAAPDRFLSQNPRFVASPLARYTPADFVARMDRWGIAWHEKAPGQLFCDGRADQVVAALCRDLADAGGRLRTGCAPCEVRREAGGFAVGTARGTVAAGAVIVATGGLSIPKLGATGYGLEVARAFGLRVVPPRPGLVPLTFGEDLRAGMAALAGLAVPARVAAVGAGGMAGGTWFEDGLLFTHRGLSGPSILQVSSHWAPGGAIAVDFLPGRDAGAALAELRRQAGARQVGNALAALVPERLATAVAGWAGVAGRLADLDRAGLARLAGVLGGWRLVPTGSEGWRTAEVTLGGVDTRDLDARTMQARAVPGLFFAGEVVDVAGWLGGYNFQWAWASGWVAGRAA